MTVLLLAAVLAGFATILSPCVLPVLPVVLVGGVGAGRSRAIGIAVGLVGSFTLFTLAAARALAALGLPGDALRHAAVALLALLGLSLAVPRVGELAGRPFAPLAAWAGRRVSARPGAGFAGGVALGVGLGALWTPCAGPVLAAVTVLAAEQRVTADAALVTLAYAAGAGLSFLLVALASQRVLGSMRAVRAHAPAVRRASGVALLAAAALFTTTIPERLATAAPGYTSGLQGVERSSGVEERLRELADGSRGAAVAAPRAATAAGADLADRGPAPDFTGITAWLNTPDGAALTLPELRGRVVLLDFWTYSCINCLRVLPFLKDWDERYRALGLTIVGVHSPEFAFEHERGNVEDAVRRHGIGYPVALDNDFATWQAWDNRYWPSTYLVDRAGRLRFVHLGEDRYGETEAAIRELLGEPAAPLATPAGAVERHEDALTPEIYLGSLRGDFRQPRTPGEWRWYDHQHRIVDETTLGGQWRVQPEYVEAGSAATIRLRYFARRAYVVLAPPASGAVDVRVSGAGRVQTIHVDREDLYAIADDPSSAGDRELTLQLPPGTRAFAFTFG